MAGYDFRDYDYEDDEDYTRRRCCGCARRRTPSGGKVAPPGGSGKRCGKGVNNNVQLLLLLAALGVGVGLGVFLRTTPPFDQPKLNPRSMWYLEVPAELFVRLMTLLAVPLMVSSIVSGVAALEGTGAVAARAFAFYVGTTVLACAEGFGFVFSFQPGADVNVTAAGGEPRVVVNRVDTMLDLLRNLLPDNIISPAFQSAVTQVEWVSPDGSNSTTGPLIEKLSVQQRDGMNIMGLTVLSFVVGVAISSVGDKARPLANFFSAVFHVVMAIINVILWILPVGVVFMVAGTVVRLENPLQYLLSMMWFLVTVISGLATHFLITMPLLLLILSRTNPLRHFLRMARALGTALATNNSNMTLPITMECLEKNCGYDHRVVRLMCPVGATINMDGTCLYEAIAVIFIATLRGVATGPAEVLIAGVTAVLISIGAPAAGSGIVVWGLLLQSIGLPLSDVFLLIPFDWFLGRLRTAVNVWGDSVGVAVVCYFSRDLLQHLPPETGTAVDEDDGGDRDEGSVGSAECPGMVMNGSYRPLDSTPSRRKSYTLTVQNETGDRIKVSKV